MLERQADPAVYNDHREAADVGRRLKELEQPYKLAREWESARDDLVAAQVGQQLEVGARRSRSVCVSSFASSPSAPTEMEPVLVMPNEMSTVPADRSQGSLPIAACVIALRMVTIASTSTTAANYRLTWPDGRGW